MDPLAELGHKDRSLASPWVQMGVAVHLEGLDISRWDEYRRDRIGRVNKVLHYDGTASDSVVVDGAANFGAAFASDRDPSKRVYEGMLGERLRYMPLFERRIDATRDQYEYFVSQDNGTRASGDVLDAREDFLGETQRVLPPARTMDRVLELRLPRGAVDPSSSLSQWEPDQGQEIGDRL